MEHAITSTRPKLRYMIGWDANLLWRTASFLPSEMQDLVYFSFPKPQGISRMKEKVRCKQHGCLDIILHATMTKPLKTLAQQCLQS